MSLVMTAGLPLGNLASTIFPYPTQSEVLKRLGDACDHTCLVPGVKRFFEWLLQLQR